MSIEYPNFLYAFCISLEPFRKKGGFLLPKEVTHSSIDRRYKFSCNLYQ